MFGQDGVGQVGAGFEGEVFGEDERVVAVKEEVGDLSHAQLGKGGLRSWDGQPFWLVGWRQVRLWFEAVIMLLDVFNAAKADTKGVAWSVDVEIKKVDQFTSTSYETH